MNSFRQHIPAFVEVDKPKEVEFKTTEELLSIPAVLNYVDKTFSHFAKSENYLMAIYENGNRWWVVGYIKNPEDIDLPIWSAPDTAK